MLLSTTLSLASFFGAVTLSGSALAQPVGAPTPSIGDMREYQVVDDWTNQVRYESRHEIIGTLDGFVRLRIEGRVLNPKTNVLEARAAEEETGRSDLNPDYETRAGATRRMNYAWPLEVGKKWSYSYATESVGADGQRTVAQFTMAAEVTGWENVTTPAGTFRTLKVVHKGTIDLTPASGPASQVGWTSWYAPQVGNQVKATYRWDSASGVPGSRTTTVLTSYKKAGGN